MPINAFTGDVGSGKTYGVIEHVILPAIANGRFVITNIDGLNTEAIYEYVAQEFYSGKIICIGHIRNCHRDAPEKDDFFPGVESLDVATPVPAPDTPKPVGGDLVVIDEATRYWVAGEKVSRSHQFFFREHRHFANECGHTCDLVVLDPDISLLARFLKGKIEMTSVTHQPKELGLNKYVVRLFRKTNFKAKPVSISGPHPFRPEITALYRSYSVKGAKEQAIDGRQSQVRALVVRSVISLVSFLAGVGVLIWLVRGQMKGDEQPAGSSPQVAAPGAPGGSPAAAGPLPSGVVPVADDLQVVGHVVIRGDPWVVVSDGGRLRLESPGAFVGRGALAVGVVDGKRVTTWSGPRPAVPGAVPASSVFGGGK